MSTSPLLILSGVQGDTRRYRGHHLYEQLRLAGVDCALAHLTDPRAPALAAQADALVLQRVTWDRAAAALVEQAQRRGAPVLLDLDDLVFDEEAFRWIDSPDFADPTRVRLYRENMRRNRATLEHSQAALTSTGYLAKRVSDCGKPARVHRNGFSLEMLHLSNLALAQPRPPRERVVIGYASGTPTHDRDFALIRPALQALLERRPQVEVWLIGRLQPGGDWGGAASRVRRVDFVPWRRLPALLAGLDVNLAPLRLDNPFSQSKSEIKWMEAALVGVPTVASPTDAFAAAIRPGENGLLAGGPEEWLEGLLRLVDEPEERHRLGAAAREDALRGYAPWLRAPQALAALREAGVEIPTHDLSGLAGGLPPLDRIDLWLDPRVERRPTVFDRGLYSLRARGPLTLAQEVWIYLRRLAAPVFPFKPRRPGQTP